MQTFECNGLNRRDAKVFVQSFETSNLKRLDDELEVPVIQQAVGECAPRRPPSPGMSSVLLSAISFPSVR